ncbi:MAG: methionyl-tRNA formyltransferase [Clostridiales bacterium]|nr:methionyl-tRNA formyltransferase [Clostridiales bacterium]
MKIIFAGSPQFAVPAFLSILEKYGVCAVLTQPDRPLGRKQILTPTPVKAAALERGVPVYAFDKVRNHIDEIKALGADLMITCAYGQILPKALLDIFPLGVWNLHASLLPKFRGASPVESAILAGESHTGITVMKTEEELDSGDILLVKRCEIGDRTCGELKEQLSRLAAEAAVEGISYIQQGNLLLLMQDEAKVSLCKKIKKEDAKIDFNGIAPDICRIIKAYSPEPAAFCYLNGQVLNIFNAQVGVDEDGTAGEVIKADKRGIVVKCSQGSLVLTSLQLAGGKKMAAADFVNGRKIKAGDILE